MHAQAALLLKKQHVNNVILVRIFNSKECYEKVHKCILLLVDFFLYTDILILY